ncbi:hypothetical protein GF367_02000 [Candidatus Woesearchaeota archaeon]|nr:hypothetical protein [Candidatus Woesearchaeota archaeon]
MREATIITRIRELSRELQSRHGYTRNKLLDLLNEEKTVPATIFSTNLSPLRSLVTYLHDQQGQEFQAIAASIKRSYRSVWGAYHEQGLQATPTAYVIPLSIFDHKKSVLEAVVSHLRKHYQLRFTQIGKLLHKDPRTIWTVWQRAQKK